MNFFHDTRDLNERERSILRAIVHLYILHASPVGSRFVARYLEREFRLSPATVRNVMADLEDRGYITHPHTSAGRMPTDRGYRLYVDSLMSQELLSSEDTRTVVENLVAAPREQVLRDASRVLGSLSHALGLVRLPVVADVIVRRVELIPLSSERLLIVLALDSELVRTMTIETGALAPTVSIDDVTRVINERLSGRPLKLIGELFPLREFEGGNDERGLIRLFVEHVGRLSSVNAPASDTIHVAGTQHMLEHPEFVDPERMRSVIELVENEEVIVHLLSSSDDAGVRVRIGNELDDQLQDYAMISTTYRIGDATGSVGVIGPKRMNYGRMMSLVQFVSSVITQPTNE
jgi:heat-inducible transcriptional repressor